MHGKKQGLKYINRHNNNNNQHKLDVKVLKIGRMN